MTFIFIPLNIVMNSSLPLLEIFFCSCSDKFFVRKIIMWLNHIQDVRTTMARVDDKLFFIISYDMILIFLHKERHQLMSVFVPNRLLFLKMVTFFENEMYHR